MIGWEGLIRQSQERIARILVTEDEVKLRELAWSDFRRTARLVNDDPEAPFIIWPAINREPYQVWLPVLLAQVVRLRLRGWERKGREVAILGVPSSGSWYGEVLRRMGVLERDGWRVSYPQIDKLKNLKKRPEKGWGVLVPSYVHSRGSDGSRGKEEMVVFEPDRLRGKVAVILDDAIAEGLTFEYLGRGIRHELGVEAVVVAGAMSKEMQGGIERLRRVKEIDKVISLVEVTKEVLNDFDR